MSKTDQNQRCRLSFVLWSARGKTKNPSHRSSRVAKGKKTFIVDSKNAIRTNVKGIIYTLIAILRNSNFNE